MGTLITTYTDSPYSHCETYIDNGLCVSANLPKIVRHDKMFRLWVDVFRWKGITPEEQKIVADESEKHVGVRYDWRLLILFPWMFIWPRKARKLAANKSFMCSELVDLAYTKAHLDIREDITQAIVSPGDLGISEKLTFIGSYRYGTPRSDAIPNKRHDDQKPLSKFAMWIINNLIKPGTRPEFVDYQKYIRERCDIFGRATLGSDVTSTSSTPQTSQSSQDPPAPDEQGAA